MGRSQGVCGLLWRLSLATVLFVACLEIPAFAQFPTGTILGTVKDSSAGVVAGANITVRNTETGLTRTLPTGDDAEYRFSALPVGHYEGRVEESGFKRPTQKDVVLDV